ncbi:MAG TPA: pyridoxal-phosphate dependent enzyme [Hanamia sp.]|jgi:1-aminocyclopropane-1-carboxylate deaminase/D-cysteine desulfhydrase-like pyridoxal-dependent ACC family enzyme|nr:pyridoxal-phosphate dependent enzyme [Hanamia sp.]
MPHSLIKDILPEIHFDEPVFSKLNNDFFGENDLEVLMLRLDEIHPVISGNKLFKLIYFLEEAKKSTHKNIVTFGGAYSNHLAAAAFAAKEIKLKSIGIVRGEKPKVLSPTLLICLENEMQLEFISRDSYKKMNEKEFLEDLINKYGEHVLIPEGGFSIKGKEGAKLINEYFTNKSFTHVCLPVGTATTFAGLVDANENETEIIGFGVLKNFNDIEKRFEDLRVNPDKKYSFFNHYHFGGYAKKTEDLISFMNDFYHQNKIPLDFVYTAKMMFGIKDLIEKKYFSKGSKILCIHTGGLQGNRSLAMNYAN